MTKVDERFNQIVNEEVYPAINKAFCSLHQEIRGDATELVKYKAEQTKQAVCAYIDGQAGCFVRMAGLTSPVVGDKKHQNEDLYDFFVVMDGDRICSKDIYSESELLTQLQEQLEGASKIVIKPIESRLGY